MKKALLCLVGALCISFTSYSAAATSQPLKQPLRIKEPLQDKNFYVLSILQRDDLIRASLNSDPELRHIRDEVAESNKNAIRTCKGEATCLVKTWIWTDAQIKTVSDLLRKQYKSDAHLRQVVTTELIPSGAYILSNSLSGEDFLAAAWENAAKGLNHVLSVYGEGLPPHYHLIDSISFDVTSPEFREGLDHLAKDEASQASKKQLFFEVSLDAALRLLKMNHRDEAGRFEPLETGENKAALARIPTIAWSKFPYSAILVPGIGPTDRDSPISPGGREVVALAAERYKAGKAPLLLLSGGYVHPSQTHFAEAIEMKKVLMQEYGIPENSILIDPHARHTTTNFRNAAREVYRYSIPMDKPMLVASNTKAIAMIGSQAFVDRCIRELGYVPFQLKEKISVNDLSFFPRIDALEIDPVDPLDP